MTNPEQQHSYRTRTEQKCPCRWREDAGSTGVSIGLWLSPPGQTCDLHRACRKTTIKMGNGAAKDSTLYCNVSSTTCRMIVSSTIMSLSAVLLSASGNTPPYPG
ncbi:hypothetical protein MKX08_009708 [Trichoderma sp. CBMAI-0020]|nr:hypothetical protein MKX08_009708 [Trichoderma sp. CBMAI-0020]